MNPLVMTAQSPVLEPVTVESSESSDSLADSSMVEYYQLRSELLVTTVAVMAIAFPSVWYFYNLNIALNYLLGAMTGLVYLGLLARNVERLGQGSGSGGKSQVAVFVGVIIITAKLHQLHVLPVFLGFLTFKVALLIYTLRTIFALNATDTPSSE
jgi:ATP synthase protein I